MNQGLIIDSVTQEREKLVQWLSPLGFSQLDAFTSFQQAQSKLESLQNFQGLVILELSSDLKSHRDLVMRFRDQNPQASLILRAVSSVDEDMGLFMQIDADQLLLQGDSKEQFAEKVKTASSFRERILPEEKTNPSIVKFETTVDELSEKYYLIRMIGSLSEVYPLPQLKPKSSEGFLIIDCEHLRVINSVGIKIWLAWMKILNENGFSKIQFDNLRPGYLQLASFVHGFIPANGSVNSFYLHYWNDELDLKKNFKFIEGVNFDSKKIKVPKYLEVDENGQKLKYELDDAAALILRFFKSAIDIVE